MVYVIFKVAFKFYRVNATIKVFLFYCIVFYCILLCFIVLYCIIFHCIFLYCIVLYYISLYFFVLYCIVLYFIVFYWFLIRVGTVPSCILELLCGHLCLQCSFQTKFE